MWITWLLACQCLLCHTSVQDRAIIYIHKYKLNCEWAFKFLFSVLQVAAVIGIGLVYQGTGHRHNAEVLLSEIGVCVLHLYVS